MGGKESTPIDTEYYKKLCFDLNLLVYGNYNEEIIEKDTENIKQVDKNKDEYYIKEGRHKELKEWKYYFFSKDKNIGKNTLSFLRKQLIKRDYKNLILFYSGLKNYTYNDLFKFYDDQADIYQINTIIVTKNDENFNIPILKNMNKSLIRTVKEREALELLINIIEITSYYNELGDEIGFPKRFINKQLLEKDEQLMLKYSFTINILVCGKPGAGKSTLINRILGKNKCFSGKGTSSLTLHVVKYIHDKYPITIYDTPPFEKYEDIERVRQLISDKNKTLGEEKNRIHCILYCMNTSAERIFIKKEFEFLVSLINNNLDVFVIATHAKCRKNYKDYIEATKLTFLRCSNDNEKYKEFEKYIFPVELVNDDQNNAFGIKEIFISLYQKYSKEKIFEEITYSNMSKINTFFINNISKENEKERLQCLARRAKTNFKFIASSMGCYPNVKGTTMLSNAIIKII